MGRARGSPTTPALVAAVSEAGGLGCLGATGMEPREIRAAISEIRALTTRPFGVDLLLPGDLESADAPRVAIREQVRREHPDHWRFVLGLYEQFGLDPDAAPEQEWALSPTLMRRQAEAVLDERVPVFAAALGDPRWIVPLAREAGTKVLGLCGSVRHAERQLAAGVDVVVAQGHEAGGHTGSITTLVLVPQVVDAVAPTPVVAAGGIADGRTVAAALALGAQGVWCGTAFLFAEEIDLFPEQRDQLARVEAQDLVVGRSYTGKPSRVVRNEITEAWRASGLDPLPMPHQTVLMEDFTYAAECAGRVDLVNNPAGQAAGRLTAREPARMIVRRLAADAARVIEELGAQVTPSA